MRDVKVFSDAVRAEYGDHPYYLMGHSMGSFVVRMSVYKYITPDKLIIMGTGGPNPIVGVGLVLCKIIRSLRGAKHVSSMIENIAFGSYNDRFKDENDPKSWLTNDKEIREKYINDKYCTFKFTISAMHDLIQLNKSCNEDEWFKTVSNKMPMLLVSGEDDPVGDYGKGIKACYQKLQENGADVTMKLYSGNRHEILNDNCRNEALKDILEFIS
jgi:alpha-beta hydrolase superfamily lysophospholipase